jgi:uncharacterized protein YdeI (YjbR/CyaY-like superfamily)
MGKRDPRVDAYIEAAPAFARPILASLRETVHGACPDVQETMKWSSPHFDYRGIFCGMVAFKAHALFRFWKQALLAAESPAVAETLERLGTLRSTDDLPPKKELARLIRQGAKLNDDGVKVAVERKAKPPLETPDDLTAALSKNRKARESFETMPPSHRRDYVEWITEAKTAPTREKRLAQAMEWITEGKSRNWKYERK